MLLRYFLWINFHQSYKLVWEYKNLAMMWRGKMKLMGEDSTPASTFSSFSKVLGNLFHCSRDCLKHLAFTERVLAGAIPFSHWLKEQWENLSLISFPVQLLLLLEVSWHPAPSPSDCGAQLPLVLWPRKPWWWWCWATRRKVVILLLGATAFCDTETIACNSAMS